MCLPFDDLAERTLGKGEHLGFEWEIVRNTIGFRCGYIRILPGHPWFGKHYDEIDAHVHGGLTFASEGKACPTHGPEAEWWIGFDCAHYMDAPDPALIEPGEPTIRSFNGGVVRSQEYVEKECRNLCKQAQAAALDALPTVV